MSALILFYSTYLVLFVPSFNGDELYSFCVTVFMFIVIMSFGFLSNRFFLTDSGINFEYRFVYVFSRRMFVPFDKIVSIKGSRSSGVTILTKSGSKHHIRTTDMTKVDFSRFYDDLSKILADKVMLDT